jgi:hypothetical protein
LTGRSVATAQIQRGEQLAEIHVQQMPAGVYVLRVEMKQQQIQIPVVIQH